MNAPMGLTIAEDYARFYPKGEVSLRGAVEMVKGSIAFCREQGVPRLLADVTRLTGYAPPTLSERYWFVQEWAEAAKGAVSLAMVARPEYIDPEHFGVTVALNAGLRANVFASDSEALASLAAISRILTPRPGLHSLEGLTLAPAAPGPKPVRRESKRRRCSSSTILPRRWRRPERGWLDAAVNQCLWRFRLGRIMLP